MSGGLGVEWVGHKESDPQKLSPSPSPAPCPKWWAGCKLSGQEGGWVRVLPYPGWGLANHLRCNPQGALGPTR